MFLGAADNIINSINYWLPETQLILNILIKRQIIDLLSDQFHQMLGNTEITLIPFRYPITNNHCL